MKSVVSNPFIARLQQLGLEEADISVLLRGLQPAQKRESQSDIAIQIGDDHFVAVLLDGWACKYALTNDGKRQIIMVHLPGDILNVDSMVSSPLGFNLGALSACTTALFPRDWLRATLAEYPRIREAFWALTVSENSILADRVISLGRHAARQRTARFFHELSTRLAELGKADGGRFRSPMTQNDMADLLGLSTVHVNRSLRDLQQERVMDVKGRTYTVLDPGALQTIATSC